HHLYILHRGDTSAKVQNITLTLDSRWVAVSTLRGTTHVFPITPYGGAMGVRTHTSLHVVNKLSRFHRSAGLSAEGRSNSPISHSESTTFTQSLQPYHNSTLPPFPRPTVVMPLAQLRQPFALGSPPGSSTLAGVKSVTGSSGSGSQRQRLSSLSDDNGKPLSVCAIFAKSRSWLLDPPNVTREAPHRIQRKAVDSLFVMAGHGALIQYDLDTKLVSNVAKEKICDDTPIELEVEAKAQWNLGRRKEGSQEIMPPLSADNWLIKNRNSCMLTDSTRQYDDSDDRSESWLAQVEIITHAGPHRRLWMGPQFVFKTYNTPSGSNLSHVEIEAVEIGTSKSSTNSTSEKIDHSSPLNMPLNATGRSSAVPVLIESGSYSSIEQSPKLMDRFRHDHLDSDFSIAHGDSRLKEDLADAMRESPSATASSKDSGRRGCETAGSSDNVAFFDALTAEDDHAHSASAAALASVLPNIHSYDNSSSYESLDSLKRPKASIEKIVNPLGTVTTITSCLTADVKTDILDEVVSQLAAEDTIIHENCDESLFRPVVAIFCDEKALLQNKEESRKNNEQYKAPENISNKLVVPVIAKEVNDELNKREKEKTSVTKFNAVVSKKTGKEPSNSEELPLLNKKTLEQKDNICEKNHNQNSKSKRLPEKNVSEINKTCSKNESFSKGTSSGIISSKKDQQTNEKATFSIKTNEHPAESKNLDKVIRSQIEQKEDFKMQTQKELENSDFSKAEIKLEKQANLKELHDDSNLNYDLSKAEATIKKEKVRNLSSREQSKYEHIRNVAKISNDRVCHEYISEATTNVKLTANITPKADQLDVAENVMDNENVGNNGNLTSQNLIKRNTATKEKINKTKGSNKPIKSGVNDILIIKPQNDPQSSDDLLEIKKNEKLIKVTEKYKNMETDNEKPDKIATNMAFNNKPQPKDVVKLQDMSETEKSHIKIKNNDNPNNRNSVESRNSEKNKEVSNVDNSTGIVILGNKKIEVLKHNKNTILDDVSINEDSDQQHAKSEYKDTSRKTRSGANVLSTDSSEVLDYDRQILIGLEKNENNDERNIEIVNLKKNEIKTEEKLKKISKISDDSTKNPANDETNLKTVNILVRKDSKSTKTGNELTPKRSISQDLTNTQKEIELCDIKQENKSPSIGTKNDATVPISPKKKGKVMSKDELKKIVSVNKKIPSDLETYNKENSKNPEKCLENKDVVKESNIYLKNKSSEKEFIENTVEVCEKQNILLNKIQNPPHQLTSAWKTLSGAEMISKNLGKSGDDNTKIPQLETEGKIISSEKLLPELPTPSNTEKQKRFDDFSILKSLDPLPPLPALEPLQLMSENKNSPLMDISLINFESPLQEKPALHNITPTPRGFTEKNLILALCGSLHYENEHTIGSTENTDLSSAFSNQSNHSSAAFDEPSLADYKSLNENEDPYMSLEQSSQETNTTTTNTTNEKFSSSTYSSGSEEIVIMEEKKVTKKQKRKKQQQIKELQNQKEQQQHQEIDDEELRPLIAMTESHVDQTTNVIDDTLSATISKCGSNQPLNTQSLLHSNTTDSEGPMPATTSDDNVFSIPVATVHNQHKIKTKKLEHKINLIAAIEAATSSSTSSAEESGVELGSRSSHDIDESLISVASSISTSIIPLPIVTTPQTTVGAIKKKSKRRKR
ncbi:CAP-Gly domain-containing linker protein 1, partial [Lucilia cuprina]|uniref:CAP-Gly domain-containing linker protein 1 n=1 Tax=Lucilia cuprina TaxID=7375 RepID=UPI001F06CAA4